MTIIVIACRSKGGLRDHDEGDRIGKQRRRSGRPQADPQRRQQDPRIDRSREKMLVMGQGQRQPDGAVSRLCHYAVEDQRKRRQGENTARNSSEGANRTVGASRPAAAHRACGAPDGETRAVSTGIAAMETIKEASGRCLCRPAHAAATAHQR
jgi:hypothetical protein